MNSQTNNLQVRNHSHRNVWGGPIAGGIAFGAAGFIDWLISSRACFVAPEYLRSGMTIEMRWTLALITISLFALAVAGAVFSYRRWRRLAQTSGWLHSEAYSAAEFVALAGLFISAILACGIFWIGLPLTLVNACMRAH